MIGLRAQIGAGMALAAALPLLLVALAWIPLAHELARSRGEDLLRAEAERSARLLDQRLQASESSARVLAADLIEARPDRRALEAMLSARISLKADISAIQVVLQPAEFQAEPILALHLRRQGEGLRLTDLVGAGYEFHSKPWFRRALTHPEGEWTPAYFNESAGGRDTLTFHVPLPAQGRDVEGVVSFDLTLDRLEAILAELRDAPGSRGIDLALVDAAGRILVDVDPQLARVGRLDRLPVARQAHFAALSQARERGEVVFQRDPGDQLRASVRWPVGKRDWQLVLSAAEPLWAAGLQRELRRWPWAVAATLVLILLLAWGAARRVSAPLLQLAQAADALAAADFAAPVAGLARRDELGTLARALERARQSIESKVGALREAGERDRRLNNELDVARDIQKAMVPRDRVFLSAGRALTVAGALLPAKAVGGDFYNFFALGEGEVFFLIGDVSDKGVPSALFASRLNSLIASHARQLGSPAEALAAAATELYRSNDTGLFATALIGRLRLQDGAFSLACAGHDPPLRLAVGGTREWIDCVAGAALGFEEHPDYVEWQGRRAPGEQLLLYTDGVTEAMTRDLREFGRERIEIAIERHMPTTPMATVEVLVQAVEAFADGADPADDLTLLVLGLAERDV